MNFTLIATDGKTVVRCECIIGKAFNVLSIWDSSVLMKNKCLYANHNNTHINHIRYLLPHVSPV